MYSERGGEVNKGKSFVLANDMSKQSSESNSADFDPLRKENKSSPGTSDTASPWAWARNQLLPCSHSFRKRIQYWICCMEEAGGLYAVCFTHLNPARPREIKRRLQGPNNHGRHWVCLLQQVFGVFHPRAEEDQPF